MAINWELITGGNEDETIDVSTTRSINRLSNEATVTLDDPDGTIADNYDFGDQVLLQRVGGLEWVGIKTGGRERLDRFELQANSYDYYLTRTVTVRYEATLISTILEDLISKTPIKWNSNNVTVSDDREITWELRGETIKEGMDDLSRLSAGEHFGVQNDPTTNEFFFEPRATERAPYDFTEDNYISAEFGDNDRKEVNRVIVYYNEGEDRDKVVVEDTQAINDLDSSATEGDAVLEISKYYPQITSETVADVKANALLDRFSSVQFGTITVGDGYELEPGQETRVVSSRNNIDDDYRIVTVEHEWLGTDAVRVAEAVDGVLSELTRNKDETRRVEHQSIADPEKDSADETLSPTRGSAGQNNPTTIQVEDIADSGANSIREFVPDGSRLEVEVAGVLPDDPANTDPDLSAEVLSLDATGSALTSITTVTPTNDEVSVQTDTIADGEVILYDADNVVLDRVPANSSGWEDTSSVGGADVEGVRVVDEESETTAETISVNDEPGGAGATTTVDVDVTQESVLHETRDQWADGDPLVRRAGPLNARFAIRNRTDGGVTAGGRWVYALTREPTTTVTADTVYVGSDDNNLYAVDASDGTEQWSFATGEDIYSSPAVVDGIVYVGSADGNLYAVDANSGTEQWRFGTGGGVYSSPTVADGTVYIGNNNYSGDHLHAVDASDGTEQWSFDAGGIVESSSAVVDGTVYVGSNGGNLYAVDASDGTEQWRFGTGGGVYSSPAVVADTVYIGSGDANLYAVDASDGAEQWRFGTDKEFDSSPAVVDGTVYVGNDDGNLYAVDASDGTEQWRFGTGQRVYSSPAVVDGTVYIGSSDANLYAVDAADGTEQWRFGTGDIIDSSPAIDDIWSFPERRRQ